MMSRLRDGFPVRRAFAGVSSTDLDPFILRTMAHVTVQAGATVTLPWQPDYTCLVYALLGTGAVGAQERAIREGQLALMGAGDSLTLAASPGHDLDVLLLGGAPIGDPVVQYGPFMMNTREEIVATINDFNAGKLDACPPKGCGSTTIGSEDDWKSQRSEARSSIRCRSEGETMPTSAPLSNTRARPSGVVCNCSRRREALSSGDRTGT